MFCISSKTKRKIERRTAGIRSRSVLASIAFVRTNKFEQQTLFAGQGDPETPAKKNMGKTNVKGTRSRRNRVEVYLNDDELRELDNLAVMCRHDRSKCIRELIRFVQPLPAPSVEVKELIRQLQAVGNSLNQIAAKANALGFVDAVGYRDDAASLYRLCGEIREAFAKGGAPLGNH